MSLRSRTDGYQLPPYVRRWEIYNPSGVYQGAGQDGPHGNQTLASEIIDVDPSTYRRGFSPYIKPVWHHTCRTQQLLRDHQYRDTGNYLVKYVGGVPAHTDYSAGNAAGRFPFCPPAFWNCNFLEDVAPGTVQALVDAAQNEWSAIPTQMSFANDLLEIADLRRLATSFRDAGASIVRLIHTFFDVPYGAEREAMRRLGRDWRSARRSSNNAFLAFNFGLKPLLKTVKDLVMSVDRIAKRLAFLRVSAGRWTTLHSSRRVRFGPTPAPSGWGSNTAFQEWDRAEGVYVAHIGAKLFQTLEGLYDFSAWLKAFRDYAGFNQILAIPWNAIPYSFVIDWIANIGDQLETFKQPSAFEGSFNLANPWTSVRLDGHLECIKWHYPANTANSPQVWSSHSVRMYVRFPGLPSVPAGVTMSWPSWFQQVLFGSLAYQAHHS